MLGGKWPLIACRDSSASVIIKFRPNQNARGGLRGAPSAALTSGKRVQRKVIQRSAALGQGKTLVPGRGAVRQMASLYRSPLTRQGNAWASEMGVGGVVVHTFDAGK